MALNDYVKRIDNINLHTGLNIIADIRADSEEEALEISKNHAEALLNIISFSSLTYCDPATLVSIINIVDDKEGFPLSYYVYPLKEQEIISSINKIDESTFRTIFEAYDRSSYQPRTLRALTWLRKGIGEDNFVDQFTSYWIGLEVIKHILSPEKTNTEAEWQKVGEIFTDTLHFKDFKKIRHGGRVGLLHGSHELSNEFVREIGSYLEPIRKTLIFCIGSVLGLEDNITTTIMSRTPRRIEQSPWSIMKGNLKNLPRDFGELIKNYPKIDAEIINKQFSINEDGSLSIRFKVTHHFRGSSAIKWELREIEQWGKKDAGIQGFTLDEANINKGNKLPLFITFEGGEGCGKSVQAKALYRRLSKLAIPALLTHEPGGTSLGKRLARCLKWAQNTDMSPLTELLLFNASRTQLIDEVIHPNLAEGKIVICDRYADSTTAYQGYGRGLDSEMVAAINNAATRGLKPNLTVLLDIPAEAGLARKSTKKQDRFEQEEVAFHQRVRQGYLKLAASDPERWLVIDASKNKEEIAQIIWQRVRQLLPSRGG